MKRAVQAGNSHTHVSGPSDWLIDIRTCCLSGQRDHAIVIRLALPPEAVVLTDVETSSTSQSSR